MRLSFIYYPKLNNEQLAIIEELSFHTTKLYNIANYENVTHGFHSYVEMNTLFKTNWHKDFLHSHTYQQCLKIVEQDWKSYFGAIKDFKKNPYKYLGIPRSPKYKNKKYKNQVIFTNLAIRVKNSMILLSLSKMMQSMFNVKSLNLTLPKQVSEHINMDALQQIKLDWDNSKKSWYLIIIYKQAEVKLNPSFSNIMAIDLGLDNLCACTFKDSDQQHLLNGKPLKSKNSYYNKEIARLTGIQMKATGNKKFKRTKRISSLQRKRNNYMHDVLHKASKRVISLALDHKCKTIVIGDIKGIKQESPIKGFVQIPIQKLVELIKYKAKLIGIEVVLIKEYYTSGVSAFDLEPIDKKHYNEKRRIKRGLFITNQGHKVNSDVNGSLNILRKYDNVVPMVVSNLRDNGCLNHPTRILIA